MNLKIAGQTHSLHGAVRLPGDKSLSHRALLLGGLARGATRLQGFLRAGVTKTMLDCLRTLGVDAEFCGPDDLLILGSPWRSPAKILDCQDSGSTMRMLLGALAPQPISATLDGTPRLRKRPMGRVVEPLRRMGAEIVATSNDTQPPLTVRGQTLHGIKYDLPVASAQVKTAILLAALYANGPTTLREPAPSRDHTERLLQSIGVSVAVSNGKIKLTPDSMPLLGFKLDIPGDISSAAFPLTAALLIPGSRVTINDVGVNPTRTGLLDTLLAMGGQIQFVDYHQTGGEPVANLDVTASGLRAVQISGNQVVRMIDEFPIFAVAATQAEGESVVRDAAELRLKESDRITALVSELRKMGARIEEYPDGFVIEGPTRLHGAIVESHNDHRLAMALAVAGLIAEDVTRIKDADCIEKSFPGFVQSMITLGAEIR